MSATGGRTPPSMITYAVLGVSVLAALWAAAMLTPAGQKAYVYVFAYTEFYVGVVALVALSITIMVGLVATDRLVLSIRQRVLLQSAHRTTGVIAVVALFFHVWTKVAMNYIGVIDVFIPFLAPYKTMLIGFGTISGYIMVMVMWTGIARSRFVGKGKPWMWRGIHAISYLMWPIALLHGLGAGRQAKPWVIVSYIICILLVLVGLAVRLSVRLNRRKDFASQAGTGTGKIQPVGKLVPTTTPSVKGRGKSRRDDAVVVDGSAALATWTPAAGRQFRLPRRPARGRRGRRAR
ncbi:translation initiation factor III, partial [Actinoplanes sp. NPDC048791]